MILSTSRIAYPPIALPKTLCDIFCEGVDLRYYIRVLKRIQYFTFDRITNSYINPIIKHWRLFS